MAEVIQNLISRIRDLTFTDAGLFVEVVARRTLALEAAEGVDAVPSLAQARQLLALIDVCDTNTPQSMVPKNALLLLLVLLLRAPVATVASATRGVYLPG